MNDQESSTGNVLKIVMAVALTVLTVGYLTYMFSDRSITMLDVQQCFNACERKHSQMKLVTRFSCECMTKNDTAKWVRLYRCGYRL